MSVVLVTVVGPSRQLDLMVAADVPVAALLVPLAEALGVAHPGMAPCAEASGDWSLRLLGGDPIPEGESLTAAGVRDGDVLVVRGRDPAVAMTRRSSLDGGSGGDPGAPRGRRPAPGPVIAVLSAGARMGRTTATVQLAAALAAGTGQVTVAVDAHPEGDSLSGRLAPGHAVTAADLLALISHPALTREELLACLTWPGPRLGLLPSRGGRGPPLVDRDWRRLLGGLAHQGLALVVDCPPGLGRPEHRAVLASADQLVLLVEPAPSPASRRMARALADRGLPVVAVPWPAEAWPVAELLTADWAALGLAVPSAAGHVDPPAVGRAQST
jgi:hypothetical protein